MKKYIRNSIPLVMITLMFSTCAYQSEPLVRDKRTLYYYNLNSVAVMPFIDYTNTNGTTVEVSRIFTEELARFNESGVVHSAAMVDHILSNKIDLNENNIRSKGIAIGKAFKVDAIIIGAITEYDEYFPPKLGLSIEVITLNDGETVFATSETYDASYNFVREELKDYCGKKKVSDSVFGEELIMQKMDLYIQFVSYQIIKKNL